MNRRGLVFLLFIAMSSPSAGMAASPSLLLEHVRAGATVEGADRVFEYSLRITPTGVNPVSGLTLALVPLSVSTMEEVLLEAGGIAAGESVEISFRLLVPAAIPEAAIEDARFSWSGRCLGEDGSATEFPAESRLVEEDRP